MGTRPARERETLIHQGAVVVFVFVGGFVMDGAGVIGLLVFVGVGVMIVIGVFDLPGEVAGAGT